MTTREGGRKGLQGFVTNGPRIVTASTSIDNSDIFKALHAQWRRAIVPQLRQAPACRIGGIMLGAGR